PPSGPGGPKATAREWDRPGPPPHWSAPPKKKWDRRTIAIIAGAVVAVVLLVIGGVVLVMSHGGKGAPNVAGSPPTTTEAQADWQPITNARVARTAAATTQADGTIWIFGGVGGDGAISGRHE